MEYLKSSFFVLLKYYLILLLLFLHSSQLWVNFLAHWQANFLFMIAKGVSCTRPKACPLEWPWMLLYIHSSQSVNSVAK